MEQELLDLKINTQNQREKKKIYLEEKIRVLKHDRTYVYLKISRNEKEIENLKVLMEFIQKFDIIFPNDIYGQPKAHDDEDNKLKLFSERSVFL